jgi:hypothetical protein
VKYFEHFEFVDILLKSALFCGFFNLCDVTGTTPRIDPLSGMLYVAKPLDAEERSR